MNIATNEELLAAPCPGKCPAASTSRWRFDANPDPAPTPGSLVPGESCPGCRKLLARRAAAALRIVIANDLI